MRLKHIKLSGFKSFVDPTHVSFPSALSGVVGPNGCGKSNIIDAVRWVMGESSAKHLRGESIADVIFNGTTGRKPVGQASVELVFDNNDGRLTGEYAAYSEISIRRVVNREAQSIYFLNNTRCRRRDIMDIFRGTGLGPRSYAIIEQGMISRLIEAKPEELRVYLEETAGITKYKDRRRETELRIEHTKANLDRLSDLQEELTNQLERLQRQAKAAEKYKELKEEERKYTGELYGLRWKILNEEIQQQQQQLNRLLTEYERYAAEQAQTQKQIEQARLNFTEHNDKLQTCQADYYAASGEVNRVEQEINHLKQRAQSLQADLAEAQQSYQTANALTQTDTATIERCQKSLTELAPQLDELQQALSVAQTKLEEAEEHYLTAQQQYDQGTHKIAELQKQKELLSVQIQHSNEQISNAERRTEKLQTELQAFTYKNLFAEQQGLENLNAEQQNQLSELLTEIDNKTAALNQQQQTNQQMRHDLHQLRVTLQQLRGQHASLQALQKAALGHDNKSVSEWLDKNQLQNKPCLAEGLQVEPQWELAAECVLAKFLPAIVVDEVSLNDNQELPGHLCLFNTNNSWQTSHDHAGWIPLQQQVKSQWPLISVLAGVFCANDLPSAMAQRHQLKPHESFITPQGIWVGRDWLYVYKNQTAEAGIITRQHQLTELEQEITTQTQQVDHLAKQLEIGEHEVTALDKHREELRTQHREKQTQFVQQQSRMKEIQTKIAHEQQREATITQELQEQNATIKQAQDKIEHASGEFSNLTATLENLTAQQQLVQTARESAREAVRLCREKVDKTREQNHQHTVQVNALRSELNATTANLKRIQQQIADLTQRQQHLNENIQTTQAPLNQLQGQLTQILEKQLEAEQVLASKRDQVAELEKELRELEQQLQHQNKNIEKARNDLEGARLALATTETRCATINEQLSAMNVEPNEVLANLPPEANETSWAAELEAINQRIKRLGAINLAAIEEFTEANERKQFLDAQTKDVQEALDILLQAIEKIDQETRETFRQTYDAINNHLRELFPKVFGGGEAYLELTDEDVLSAGVRVIARPPGKKNSSIHLLSGGEKALTAIALVFSFFNLQPSPFCMLDEVDAPLDDANVGRFCNIVKEMSKKVQFIVITHNKITMEMNEHLTGVTMREPGVSRLVSVNVEEAAELVAS